MAKKNSTTPLSKLDRAENLVTELSGDFKTFVSVLEHEKGLNKNILKHAKMIEGEFDVLVTIMESMVDSE